MTKQRFIERTEIEYLAESMRTTLEHTPLAHHRKVELASELATEQFGFTPKKSVILLAVKIANANWELTKTTTFQQLQKEQVVDIESVVDSDTITEAQRLWLECLIGCEVDAKVVKPLSPNLLLIVTHDASGYCEKYTLYTDGRRGHHGTVKG